MFENMFKLHSDMPRQGPGNNNSTKRALDLLRLDKNKEISVLDIGCGPGMQTVELAKNVNGKITALDFHKPYLNQLKELSDKEGVANKITTFEGSMFELNNNFNPNQFDLIWSEGAIYIMGFEEGLKSVAPLLKDNGYVVFSEITWLRDDLPSELKEFWDEGYPKMKNIRGNKEIATNCGYEVIDAFVLEESAWWENYYNHLIPRCEMFKKEESDNKELMELIEGSEFEMNLYRKYNEYYGYVFYVMKKK